MVEWKHVHINGTTRELRVSGNSVLSATFCFPYPFTSIALLLKTFPFAGLKKKKSDLESELEKLGSIREMQLKESEASGKISGLEKKIQYTEIEKVYHFLLFLLQTKNISSFKLPKLFESRYPALPVVLYGNLSHLPSKIEAPENIILK